MTVGFYIRKLILTGFGKKPASIEFEQGLNVVSGASNTGKTFIFQCIDFMLGGQKSPKAIDESKGYEKVFLIISTYAGELYTIQRNFKGGFFLIKKGGEDSNDLYEKYAEKLSNDSKNISTFLLSLCNMQDLQLKKNQHNVKARLSFRDVAGLCLVDEKTIISEDSPVYHSGESVTRTKEQSLFYYFLIGQDATSLAEVEDPKVLKNKIAGKIELIKELIERTQRKLDKYKGLNVEQLEKDLETQYERLNLEYRTSLVEIDLLRNKKAEYFKNIEKLESKRLFNKELLQRFDLLNKHYVTDQKRLQFILEGSFLLNQLNNISCPICGSEMNESHNDHLAQIETSNANLEISLNKELDKINLKQKELSQTIVTIQTDLEKQNKSLSKIKTKINEIDDSLNNSLAPVTKTLRERLQILSANKLELENYKSLKTDIQIYNNQLNDFNNLGSKKIENTEILVAKHDQAFGEFCTIVEQVLNEWQYPNITSLTFDRKFNSFDLKINNSPRSSNGKGYRAITYSAFLYSILRYCKIKSRNHPRLLILDSPLTTFKERDEVGIIDDSVGKNVEYNFFDSLSKIQTGEQIIILENKEPGINLSQKIKYIHFSGQTGVGRNGFFEN